MNKTLAKKVLYIAVVLALLAMMVPATTVPAGAAYGNAISMQLVNPINTSELISDGGYNVAGSVVQVDVSPAGEFAVENWTLQNLATKTGVSAADWVADPGTGTTARATGVSGDTVITAWLDNGTVKDPMAVEKKWGLIKNTVISSPASYALTWDKFNKVYTKSATVTDTVYGTFTEVGGPVDHVVQGVILNWYLVKANATVDLTARESGDAKSDMVTLQGTYAPDHVVFAANDGIVLQTITDSNGASTVTVNATGQEAVEIVVVPEYPFPSILEGVNIDVTPEITSYDFYSTIPSQVPQVRWAGEKIVLEENFGQSYFGSWAKFSMEAPGLGALEPITENSSVFTSDSTVWTKVDENGLASVILKSEDAGVSYVSCGLYTGVNGSILLYNQTTFITYFLKFESLTLGDVAGKRTLHNDGLWVMPDELTNPWDPTGDYNGTGSEALADCVTQTLNVSQDALLRARVRGYFQMSSDPTNREAETIPGTIISKPAGRWILPDDWDDLAGSANRIFWDIMCKPDGSVGSENVLGVYLKPPFTGTAVSASPIVGPFTPGIELMTPAGWQIVDLPPSPDPQRDIHTIVMDGAINEWDAPMPPAMIIFEIQAGGEVLGADAKPMDQAGFFKPAAKSDIYYKWVYDTSYNPPVAHKIYTNPFYEQLIPAHEAIPNIASGYFWDSFDSSYGHYIFWDFISQDTYYPVVDTAEADNNPTIAVVYSDNHGEAMTWLNGNWNLDLTNWANKGAADIPYGAEVGWTTIQAIADYPYTRGAHTAMRSNYDVKTWEWGGLVLGTDEHEYGDLSMSDGVATRMVLAAGAYDNTTVTGTYPFQSSRSLDKVVFIWVTDRDGKQAGVLGDKVTWIVSPGAGSTAQISDLDTAGFGISNYNWITKGINLVDGFLDGTNGVITDAPNNLNGYSYLRAPNTAEKALFNKFWGSGYTEGSATYPPTSSINGLDPNNFCVAAVDLYSTTYYAAAVNVQARIASDDYNLTLGSTAPATSTVIYDTNVIFNDADPLDDGVRAGDANCDGIVNMADVVAVERMILGYDHITTNAVLNDDGTVDMGTVVKIERTILGY